MKKKKTKSTASKISRGRPTGSGQGKKIPGTNMIIKGTQHGEDPKFVVHTAPKPDPEEALANVQDELSKHKYPPPKKDPRFRKFWGQFIDGISQRDNFSPGYLNPLSVLCDLFTEYEELSAFIRKNGRSYQSFGRSGMTWKLYPEVTHLKSVQHQINVYLKQLGLVLKKDVWVNTDGEENDWS